MEQKLISIVLPTYNRANTILDAILSVLEQTYTNFELIIVDDASQDNTQELVEALKDSRIRYVRNEINMGANASRNVGIDLSKGDYIAFQDSDDRWKKDKLEKQVQVLQEADDTVGAVYTGFHHHIGKEIQYIPQKEIAAYDKTKGLYQYLMSANIVSTQTLLVKKKCFDIVGKFDAMMPRLQDWELCIRLSRKFEFILIDEPLVDVFYTKGSISSNSIAYVRARCLILQKNEDLLTNKALFYRIIKELINFSAEHKMLKEGVQIINESFDHVINHEILIECLSTVYEKKEKFMMNYMTLNKWLQLRERNIPIEQYFVSKGYRSIAIYGIGELGKRLYHELQGSQIQIKFGIDRAGKSCQDIDLNIYSPDNFHNEVDGIVVSVINDFERIDSELRSLYRGPILSLDKIIDELLY